MSDAVVLTAYSLTLSAFKSFALAAADLVSPGFDFVADVAAFDLEATAAYIGVEQFGAASLALGWLIGGSASGACSEAWATLTEREQASRLLRGWALAAPIACALKYGVLGQQGALPPLGQSAEAAALEAQLGGLTTQNVLADVFGMLAMLALWRRLLPRFPELFP